MLDDSNYIRKKEGKYVQTSIVVETKVIDVEQDGDDHGHPRYKETIVDSSQKVLYKNKIKIS